MPRCVMLTAGTEASRLTFDFTLPSARLRFDALITWRRHAYTRADATRNIICRVMRVLYGVIRYAMLLPYAHCVARGMQRRAAGECCATCYARCHAIHITLLYVSYAHAVTRCFAIHA